MPKAKPALRHPTLKAKWKLRLQQRWKQMVDCFDYFVDRDQVFAAPALPRQVMASKRGF